MKHSKLIALLTTFSALEWRKFGEFLASPFFNKRNDLIIFYNYLKALAPDFNKAQLTEALVYKAVYPNEPFNHRNLVYLNNYMLKQAERFMVELRLEKKSFWENSYILEELMERKLDKHYRHYLNKTKNLLKVQKNQESDFFYFQFHLSDIEKKKFLNQNERKYSPIIQKSWNNLDDFYFFNKLKAACEILEWQNIIAVDYDMSFAEEVVIYLNSQYNKLNSSTKIYLTAFNLLTEEASEANFLKFKGLLNKYLEQMPITEKQNLYTLAINYCRQQINRRNNPYYYVEECLNLYIGGIEQGFLLNNGYLSPWTFKNVVKLGFNLKRFDWTEQFIQQYYTKLETELQDDALHYNLADLFYRKKDYDSAIKHLFQVAYSDIFYNLGAKTMLIMIYYELNEEEALLSNLASFTIFLKRNKKITSEVRQIYLNFTNHLNRLLRAKPNKIDTILADIQQLDLLTNKNWLLEKVNLLKKDWDFK